MQRIELPYLMRFADTMRDIDDLPTMREMNGLDAYLHLYNAETALKELTTTSVYYAYLRTSYDLAQRLLKALAVISTGPDFSQIVPHATLLEIKSIYDQYKIALMAELGTFNSYFITQKGGLDTYSLLFFGENFFPPDLVMKVSEAAFDVREAGKCLAYEVPTASGFHAFRALESVLRRYYTVVTGGAEHPEIKTISVYLSALKTKGKGSAKVCAVLKQISDLHRNPVSHPEVALTMEEALDIFGITRSAMSAMLAEMPVPPQTTTGAIAG